MRLKLFGFAVLLVLCSCASLNREQAPFRPAWLETPQAGCASDELCAVAQGRTRNAAQLNARAEISKILETKINVSSLSVETLADAELNQKIHEQTNILLNDIEIKEAFEDNGSVYALAALNKPIAAAVLKKDIEKIDEDIKNNLTKETLAAASKAETAFAQRSALNARYAVLTGTFLPDPVSYAEIVRHKRNVAAKTKIFLESLSPVLEQGVREALEKAGYTLVSDKTDATKSIYVKFSAERQHLNVEGFVRYLFGFKLSITDKKGETSETAAASFSETGRTYSQAFENAVASYKEMLSENTPDL